MESPKLTQFSPGAGCGCKISPSDLEKILKKDGNVFADDNLLVGNASNDDAAVYDLGNGTAIICTTDFFTPIVDDPYDFGRIAATNAISDVYAMGGVPFVAIAILGWPLEKLSAELAKEVVSGARDACNNLGISLAGGHSIDISDPIFGLAVNGSVVIENIKQNNTGTAGCKLFLTKPLGIGILTTAEKRGILLEKDIYLATKIMCKPNKIGAELGKLKQVKAMTDVTGFGLLGHLCEVCEGSNLNAKLNYSSIPKIDGIDYYNEKKCFPGGTFRNWKSYGHKIGSITEDQKMLLCDPQTSGGLLIAVDPAGLDEFLSVTKENGLNLCEIGELFDREDGNPVFIDIE